MGFCCGGAASGRGAEGCPTPPPAAAQSGRRRGGLLDTAAAWRPTPAAPRHRYTPAAAGAARACLGFSGGSWRATAAGSRGAGCVSYELENSGDPGSLQAAGAAEGNIKGSRGNNKGNNPKPCKRAVFARHGIGLAATAWDSEEGNAEKGPRGAQSAPLRPSETVPANRTAHSRSARIELPFSCCPGA